MTSIKHCLALTEWCNGGGCQCGVAWFGRIYICRRQGWEGENGVEAVIVNRQTNLIVHPAHSSLLMTGHEEEEKRKRGT